VLKLCHSLLLAKPAIEPYLLYKELSNCIFNFAGFYCASCELNSYLNLNYKSNIQYYYYYKSNTYTIFSFSLNTFQWNWRLGDFYSASSLIVHHREFVRMGTGDWRLNEQSKIQTDS